MGDWMWKKYSVSGTQSANLQFSGLHSHKTVWMIHISGKKDIIS